MTFLQRLAQGDTANLLHRRKLWWVVAGLLIVTWLAFLADAHVGDWIDGLKPKSVRRVARVISDLGDCPSLVVGAVFIGALGVVLRRRWIRIVCVMITAAAIAGMTANVTRCLTGRTRPSSKITQGWYGPAIGKKGGFVRHAVNSFPSAHTTTSMAFFIALFILVPEMGIWLLPAPFLIGASRLWLGVHHFSDVWVGLVLGTLVAVVTCRIMARYWAPLCRWWRTLPLPDLPTSEATSA